MQVHILYGPPADIVSLVPENSVPGGQSHESRTSPPTAVGLNSPACSTEPHGGFSLVGQLPWDGIWGHPLTPITNTSIEISNKLIRID